ncbi:hypothetical protein RhiirA4_398871 [Rhizophagus irregularis]|uniref:Uncharacterized protein n=1 Tax=Rhizophagus irregularis TaxID=588596 RepID=A0A2I1GA61_9GLOM|nr:hypothetical protein RhiirA4_398871 [Rhizophagus irregularis]
MPSNTSNNWYATLVAQDPNNRHAVQRPNGSWMVIDYSAGLRVLDMWFSPLLVRNDLNYQFWRIIINYFSFGRSLVLMHRILKKRLKVLSDLHFSVC